MVKLSDNVSRDQRRKIMQSVRSSNTALESKITRELWHRGLRFRRNVKGLVGKPDIAIKKYRIVIFIDSCFWHGCPDHCRIPSSNRQYWERKIERNRNRDWEVNDYYTQGAWNILRVWEHAIKSDFDRTVDEILTFVTDVKEANGV